MKKNLDRVDNSSSVGLRPATCSLDLEILLNAQHDCTEIERSGSREQVAGRRDSNCQQTLIWGLSLFFFSGMTSADTLNLSYEYSVPYAGGGQLTLINDSQDTIIVSQLTFTSNAFISGKPWGTLWGWRSTIQTSANPDQMSTDYVINENPAISIAPGSSVLLTYNMNMRTIGGPFSPYNAAMDSSNISVTLAGSETAMPVPVHDACQGHACDDPGHGKRIMGYYPDWAYWRSPQFNADKLPFDKINTIAYAFSIFDNNGNISLYDAESDAVNLPIISQARKRNPYLNASLSFGGWSWASTPPGWVCQKGASPQGPAACFSQLTADPVATSHFVTKAVQAMKEVHFNGLDIDWEYPTSPEDVNNYVHLLQKLRAELDAQGQKDHTHYFLTVAVGAGIDKISKITPEQWQLIAASTDYLDVMTYDFHGSWDQGQTGSDFMSAMALDPLHDPSIHTPILSQYNVIDAMNAYVNNGISHEKLVVGIPLYGRLMNIESVGSTQGLYQPITGTPQGEWDNQQSGFTGMLDYACIVSPSTCGNGYILPPLTLVSPTSNNLGQYALTPWGYAAHLFLTYDDDQSAAYKAQWIMQNHYAGVMLWDLTGDFQDLDDRSIVHIIYDVFHENSF